MILHSQRYQHGVVKAKCFTTEIFTISFLINRIWVWVFSWNYFRGFCGKVFQQTVDIPMCTNRALFRRHLSVFTWSGIHKFFVLNGKETVSISVQSHLQAHRWCIVYKQPRIWKLYGPDVSCWTGDQGHHRAVLLTLTYFSRLGGMVNFTHLRQTRWLPFSHHRLSVPEYSIFAGKTTNDNPRRKACPGHFLT